VLAPFDVLVESPNAGPALPLPDELGTIYPELAFPPPHGRPYVISNFVSTLDGVVTLGLPGQSGGGEISGFDAHDQALMGLLRAAADAVIVGAGTHRALPGHLWTPEHIYPEFAASYRELRRRLGRAPTALTVLVSGSGRVDIDARVFRAPEGPVLVVTTPAGADRLRPQHLPEWVHVVAPPGHHGDRLTAAEVLASVTAELGTQEPLILIEGGPELMAPFLAERRVDELFLTLAPQIAGRSEGEAERPGLVSGRLFAPEDPRWGALVGVRRAGSHLFLRYRISA
jgi:riboflavin biosynthesis pyrimidine reductase